MAAPRVAQDWKQGGSDVRFDVDGVALHGRYFVPPPGVIAKGAVVLVHGFNSSLEEFGHAPRWLAEAGFHALAFDQRGFGASAGTPGRTSKARALADIEAATARLEALAPGLPLGIVGHSLGGAYAAAAASTGRYGAAVLAHAVDRLWDNVSWTARPLYHVLGRLGAWQEARGKPAGMVPYRASARSLFVSKQAQLEAGRPDFLLKRASLGNYVDVRLMSGVAWAKDVVVPTLSIVSDHDRAVARRHSMAVHDALGGPKALFEHRGGHSCFRDHDGRPVTDAAIAWLNQHLAGAS